MSTPLSELGITPTKPPAPPPRPVEQPDVEDDKGPITIPSAPRMSTKDIVMNELRNPLLQLLLYVLLNLDIVNSNLYRYAPALFNSSRDLNIRGIVVKGILFAFVYYLITTFAL